MKDSRTKKFLYLNFVLSIFINISFLSSCVSAQKTSSQTQQTNNIVEKHSEKTPRLQSVNSCKIIEVSSDIYRNNFNAVGGYEVFGKKPLELNDFNNFTLNQIEISDLPDGKKNITSTVKIVGGVIINLSGAESETYEIEKVSISPQEMKFSTETINGVRYEFEGKFLKSGNLLRFNEKNIAVLQGVVKKFQSEKLVTEGVLKFKFKIWKALFPVNC